MEHEVDDVHLWVDLLFHVVILVLHLADDRPLAVLLIHQFCTLLDKALAVFKAFAVVVADDVAQLRPLYVRLDAEQVVKPLIAFCRLWGLIFRQHSCKLYGQQVGIHHLSLRIAWMHAHTFYIYLGRGGVEVLKLQLAYVAAVHRIGPVTAELLHVEVVCSHADFLVRVESDADGAVLHFGMVPQPAHGLDNLCDTCLVVGS